MLQAKTKELKNSLNQEFRLIHELCLFVLNVSQRPELIRATLSTLHAYLSWVPVGYIFESNIVEMLLRLFPQPPFRNIALQCLTEVFAVSSWKTLNYFAMERSVDFGMWNSTMGTTSGNTPLHGKCVSKAVLCTSLIWCSTVSCVGKFRRLQNVVCSVGLSNNSSTSPPIPPTHTHTHILTVAGW